MRPSEHPPTPPEMVQNGFYHLAQHNAVTSYPHENFDFDDGSQMLQRPRSAYSSPPEYHDNGHRYGSLPPSGPGISYDRGYSPDAHHFGPGRYVTPGPASPLSSSTTPGSIAPIRTRSGLNINRPNQPHKPLPQNRSRAPKGPQTKKLKKKKVKTEYTVAKLEKPLSELTKDWDHLPVVDIEAYVNRSAEDRRKEVEEGKQPGKVKRPMNSFMLYRKAYQNRTKNWCLQNNHQVVSQVCGDSWPLEPESVRQQFNDWAKLERINHQNAHPGYKFSPSKAGVAQKAPPPAKRKAFEEQQSEESDLDDFDWERGITRRPKKHLKQEPGGTPNPSYLRSPYAYSRNVSEEPSYQSYNMQRSTYQASNPGRQAPQQYSQSNLQNGQYYQQSIRQTANMAGAEDVMMRRAPTPSMTYQQPMGIPTSHDYAAMDLYHEDMPPEQRIDPSLVALDSAMFNNDMSGSSMYMGNNLQNDMQWHESAFAAMPGQEDPLGMNESTYDNLQIHDQHLQMLKGNHEPWQIAPMDSLDAGQEFDKWMDGP